MTNSLLSPPAPPTLADVAASLDAIDHNAEDVFRAVVVRLASCEQVDAAEIRAAMLGANRTRDELLSQVETAGNLRSAAEGLSSRAPALREEAEKAREAFEQADAAAAAAYREFEARMQTLEKERHRAKVAYDDARHSLMACEGDAVRLLSARLRPDVKRRLEAMGSATVRDGNRLAALRRANEHGERDRAIAAAETVIAERRQEHERIAGMVAVGRCVPDAAERAARELADAQAALDALLADRNEQEALTVKLAAAKREEQEATAAALADWRSMRFDALR